ncbi:hypothetical protein GOP47_0008606 [Adiantum capillus-veneris]|uniref:Secreted protein n=1 Tax=Adiantum capillus-veneris TaxID=13818 RepID=A0A9D4ZKK9_ADICA|nr:hypothetical protein GOP47_0008606 [Adiantum capillus-veneris]
MRFGCVSWRCMLKMILVAVSLAGIEGCLVGGSVVHGSWRLLACGPRLGSSDMEGALWGRGSSHGGSGSLCLTACAPLLACVYVDGGSGFPLDGSPCQLSVLHYQSDGGIDSALIRLMVGSL